MLITKEDVLRELELLPVWKPRADVDVPQTLTQLPATAISNAQPVYQVAVSADQVWGFVWLAEAALSTDANLLFNNICLALNSGKTNTTLLEDAALFSPNICVIFGEVAAKSWLKTNEPLVNLRGKLHQANHLQVVATHSIDDLLITPTLKREVWQDLCFARNVLTPK